MEVVNQIWSNGPRWGLFSGVRWMWKKNRPLAVGVVLVVAVVKLRKVYNRRQRRLQWAKAGKDVVVLHCLGKGIYTPSVSPFVMKLATYLRLADIKHQVDFSEPFGPKGKSPWITINGESIGDSQLVMDHLGSHFNKDFSSHLSKEDKAVAWTFALMMDEHLAWALKDWRWILDWGRGIRKGTSTHRPFWWLLVSLNRRKQMENMRIQGIGRHTHEDIKKFITRDLRAVSSYLGTKPFMMGDQPSEVDCSVFGSLVQVKYNYPDSPYTFMLENEFANLGAYVIRMKERLWPDWEKCLDKPQKVNFNLPIM